MFKPGLAASEARRGKNYFYLGKEPQLRESDPWVVGGLFRPWDVRLCPLGLKGPGLEF